MKCAEQMDGVGPRLGSRRRYLAALSNHLQDSKIKPSSRGDYAWGWWLCLTCPCIPRTVTAPGVVQGRLQSSCLSVLVL